MQANRISSSRLKESETLTPALFQVSIVAFQVGDCSLTWTVHSLRRSSNLY